MKRLAPLPPVDNTSPFGRSLGPDERKRFVLDAAARLFERRGFHGTSMQDIATEVGITKAAVYHYVSSKDELLYDIHEAFVSTMIEDARAFMPEHPDPIEQLEFIVESIFRAVAEYRPYVRAFFQDMHNLSGDEWYKRVEDKRNQYEKLVNECLENGQAAGVFEFPDGTLLASRFLFGACNWAYQWLEPGGAIAPEELARQWCVMLKKAFAPSPAASF
jgi:AcrR family transcriptional regulator